MTDELNTEMTDDQVDELYEKLNNPGSSDIPMENQNTEAPQEKLYELDENTKLNEQQLMELAKKGQQNSSAMDPETQEMLDRYKEVDAYAKENPDWWDHVQNSYGQKDKNDATIQNENELKQDQELSPEISELKNELNQIKQFISAQKETELMARQKEEDALLEAEIDGIKEQYPYLDFKTVDDKGVSLEQKVLKHAQAINTNSFRAAFRDLMHDKIVSKAQETAKESLGRDLQRKTKLGILGTEGEKVKVKSYSRDKSYEDLVKDALDELGS